MKISKELKIGFAVILGAVLLLVGVNYLKGLDLFAENNEYYAYYDNVDGLTASNPVFYKGFQVGLVKDVTYDRETGRIRVALIVDNPDIPISKNTECVIRSADLLGSKMLELKLKPGGEPAQFGDTLIGSLEKSLQEQVNEQVAPLKKKTEELIGSIDSIITSIKTFWDAGTADNLTQSVTAAKRAINSVDRAFSRIDTLIIGQSGKISRILTHVETSTSALADQTEKIKNTVANVEEFSYKLKDVELQTAIVKINDAADQINSMISKINRGEGSLGLLIHDDSLYESLLETNASVQLLINDIRNYPNRYLHFSVFGSREKVPKLNSQEEKLLKDLLDIKKDGRVIRFSKEQEDSLMKLIK